MAQFDPRKVERFDAKDEHVNSTGEFVLASDYDKLLDLAALWRPDGFLEEDDSPE